MKNKLVIIESLIIVVLVILIVFLLFGKQDREKAIVNENITETQTTQEVSNEVIPIPETPTTTVRESEEEEREEAQYPIKDRTGDGKVSIVVFGDSIWDDKRGEDGISEQLAELTGAKVYNCAIGGTSAALINESIYSEEWDSRSLNGMLYIARGNKEAKDQLTDGEPALGVFQSIEDYNQIDYYIYSYGLNDYFSKVPLSGESMYDMTTYFGAVRHASDMMPQAYPNSRVVLISPTYCKVEGGDSNTVSNGEGTLQKYVEMMKIVNDTTMEKSYFINAYDDFGINADTADEYLDDGIHLNGEGRRVYAEGVARYLSNIIPE